MPNKNSFLPRGVKLGISPLSWSNEVLLDLGADISLETCLTEASAAGFQGIELGRKFPRQPEELRKVLGAHDLNLISGWYSGFLADHGRTVAEEKAAVAEHAKLLSAMGTNVMVYGECGSMVPEAPLDVPMSGRIQLDADQMQKYAVKMDEFSRWLEGEYDLKLSYHHHLMMVAETWDEVSRLFDSAPATGLLLDTGHAHAAGFDYMKMVERFGDRINHLHLKDVRANILNKVRMEDLDFNNAVRSGMFTIPGDGAVNFKPLFRFVQESGYQGWMVVEAEQDPSVAIPGPTVIRALEHIKQQFEKLTAVA